MIQPKFLSVDQGTTSSRAIVFAADGTPLATAQKELKLHYPQNGWVEQNPDDIWNDTLECVRSVLKTHPDVMAFGITNQRETTILWNRETGKPVYNAIVWQDRRTVEDCAKLKRGGFEQKIIDKTGLLLDPYFSATKIKWILEHVEGAMDLARENKLAFGTVDSFLLWKLTGGKVHATDATNACRTMLYNICTHEWDEELLGLFKIPRSLLPEVKDNVADFGTTQEGLLEKTYPIRGMAGDQQAALIGQACFETGMVKSTYGTGCFALMNIGENFKASQNKLVTSIGYRIKGKTSYVLEGSIFVAGAAIQFLRDNLEFFESAADSEKLAEDVKGNGGVYFVPALTGLGAPYWNPEARGAILGLTRDTTRAHIARAALEAQAYQTKDLMSAFIKDSGIDPAIIRVDGGLVSNGFMVGFLADMLDRTVEIPSCAETTALGVAYLAALGSGVFISLEDIAKNWSCSKRYTSSMKESAREILYAGWKKSVGAVTYASSNI